MTEITPICTPNEICSALITRQINYHHHSSPRITNFFKLTNQTHPSKPSTFPHQILLPTIILTTNNLLRDPPLEIHPHQAVKAVPTPVMTLHRPLQSLRPPFLNLPYRKSILRSSPCQSPVDHSSLDFTRLS